MVREQMSKFNKVFNNDVTVVDDMVSTIIIMFAQNRITGSAAYRESLQELTHWLPESLSALLAFAHRGDFEEIDLATMGLGRHCNLGFSK